MKLQIPQLNFNIQIRMKLTLAQLQNNSIDFQNIACWRDSDRGSLAVGSSLSVSLVSNSFQDLLSSLTCECILSSLAGQWNSRIKPLNSSEPLVDHRTVGNSIPPIEQAAPGATLGRGLTVAASLLWDLFECISWPKLQRTKNSDCGCLVWKYTERVKSSVKRFLRNVPC